MKINLPLKARKSGFVDFPTINELSCLLLHIKYIDLKCIDIDIHISKYNLK